MNIVKKIIKSIASKSFEAVKDSAEKLGQAVNPGEMVNQLTGVNNPQKSDVGEYLENLGDPKLRGENLEKRKQEAGTEDQKALEETRKILRTTTPAHMRLQSRQPELSAFEKMKREEEEQKAQSVQANQIQRQQFVMPVSKPKGKLGTTSRKASIEGFKKDTKIG